MVTLSLLVQINSFFVQNRFDRISYWWQQCLLLQKVAPKTVCGHWKSDCAAAKQRTALLNILSLSLPQFEKQKYSWSSSREQGKDVFPIPALRVEPSLCSSMPWGVGAVTGVNITLYGHVTDWSHVVKSHHALHVAGGPLLELTHHWLKSCHSTFKTKKEKAKDILMGGWTLACGHWQLDHSFSFFFVSS